MRNYFYKILIIFVFVAILLPINFILASETQGTINTTNKAAWSKNIGWINFYTTGSGSIIITDSTITGYAWNDDFGWINLSPSTQGVKNDNEGNLSGYAWGENLGWINFSGVVINSSGKFTGKATGDIIGEINFDCEKCQVLTDWRPRSTRNSQVLVASGGGTISCQAPSIENKGFSVKVNDGNLYVNNRNITLNFKVNSDVAKFSVSTSLDFLNAIQEDYQPTKSLIIDGYDGPKNIYVKFFNDCGQSSEVFNIPIVLDTTSPNFEITDYKTEYSALENIIFSGFSEPGSLIYFLVDNDYYTQTQVDNNGVWFVNLGKKSIGKHNISITLKDLSGNIGKPSEFSFSVLEKSVLNDSEDNILEKIEKQLQNVLDNILKSQQEEIVIIPAKPPIAFSGNKELFVEKSLEKFVLSPLPVDIKMISQKFPEIKKTLAEVGVTKITDVSKLKSATLKLPGITQTATGQTELRVGEFTPVKGIPITQLTSSAKIKIPSEIIFAKAANGLVDFNTAMSINEKGNVEQRIKTIAREKMQFIVKVNSPANSVKGYLIFKSKNNENISYNVSLNDLTASLLFASPDLAKIQQEPLEDVVQIEKKLIVEKFDYANSGDGIYVAEISMPAVTGEYQVVAIVDYKNPELGKKEVSLITVIDPEGYIYEKNNNKETRIYGAIVSLYWLNPETKQYQLWPAAEYQQENPQITNVTGSYSFLVPEGSYYLGVSSPGYLDYNGKPFDVKEGSGVHANIQLKTKFWWLSFFDWKTILLIIVIGLLLYNFYKDKLRDLVLIKK